MILDINVKLDVSRNGLKSKRGVTVGMNISASCCLYIRSGMSPERS